MRDRPTHYSGLILLLFGPVLFASGLYLEWREIMSRTPRINGPGGTFTLLMPSIHTLPPWPLRLAGIGLLLAL